MNKNDGCVLYLRFASAVAARSVEQRLFKRAESELLGEEHQKFHAILLAATFTCEGRASWFVCAYGDGNCVAEGLLEFELAEGAGPVDSRTINGLSKRVQLLLELILPSIIRRNVWTASLPMRYLG
jgi:hypothetical protein